MIKSSTSAQMTFYLMPKFPIGGQKIFYEMILVPFNHALAINFSKLTNLFSWKYISSFIKTPTNFSFLKSLTFPYSVLEVCFSLTALYLKMTLVSKTYQELSQVLTPVEGF
jgi:TRAP-type C4-dicarboxylate transport system permease small subunit